MRKIVYLFGLVILMVISLSACSAASDSSAADIVTSGTISAIQIDIAPELGGKVSEVAVREGDFVQEGDILFKLDDELLQAQHTQAETAIELASATLDAARLQLEAAQIQADLVLQSVRLQNRQQRQTQWQVTSPEVFGLPNWYFDKDEMILSAKQAVDLAEEKLSVESAWLEEVLKGASNQEFLSVEQSLAGAQAVYQAAQLTLDQVQSVSGEKEDLVSVAQKALDVAAAELEARQLEYNRMLSTSSAETVLEARARAAVAQTTLDNALDEYDNLQTDEQSLSAQAAEMAVSQAETAVTQAEAGLAQAEAALAVLDLQIEKSVVKAPAAGTLLSLSLDAGEVVGAGSIVMVLGQLDEVTLTVYIPEDRYGQVKLGQQVSVAVDSFPGRAFSGTVRYIADEAEFTPRNVQTTEGRKTTVYAVKISLENSDQALKPGMSADITFD
jgi:HlyD family secretion protein